MTYISIEDLDYYYANSNEKSLDSINLKIEKGELIFILGKSGSGKSTLARALTGVIPNFYGGRIKGDIKINHKSLRELTHYERAKEITMVFQDPEKQLFMNKVHREIAFGLENIGIDSEQIKRRVWESMQFCNILDIWHRDINTLSGGQKQKVAIASALSVLTNCIVLDEPLSQLDPIVAEEIISLIKKVNEELGITIIIIEQRIDKWFDFADRIVIMEEGRLAFVGTQKELFEKDHISYFPNYLKAYRYLGCETFPENFKKCRGIISSLNIKFKTFEDNIIKKENNFFHRLTKKERNNTKSLLQIEKLKVSYGDIKAVEQLSFVLEKNDFCFILGANGSGKSSLFKAIMNLVPFEGTIKSPLGRHNELTTCEISKHIGYVSQNPNDYISKDTVYEELMFTLNNHGIKVEDNRVNDILKELGIEHLAKINPRDLSGGERQRVAIASILVLKPEVILLDEPTRGLDWEAKVNLGNILRELKQRGNTILVITHDVDFASEYGNKIVIMINGRIVSEGSPREVFLNGIYYKSSVSKLFWNKAPFISLEDLKNIVN